MRQNCKEIGWGITSVIATIMLAPFFLVALFAYYFSRKRTEQEAEQTSALPNPYDINNNK
jgi:hypothetical protein